MDLEALRHIFKDPRHWIGVGKIAQVALADDRSFLKCMVEMFDATDVPENRKIVTRMSWDMVGPECGIFAFPNVGDMVLVAFAEGDVNHAFIIKRLTSREDKIPLTAIDGSTVVKAGDGKNVWITANGKRYLSNGDTPPTENIVLGQQLKTLLANMLQAMSDMANQIENLTVSGNLGYPTSTPNNSAAFASIKTTLDSLKASPVNDGAILSTKSFTD